MNRYWFKFIYTGIVRIYLRRKSGTCFLTFTRKQNVHFFFAFKCRITMIKYLLSICRYLYRYCWLVGVKYYIFFRLVLERSRVGFSEGVLAGLPWRYCVDDYGANNWNNFEGFLRLYRLRAFTPTAYPYLALCLVCLTKQMN